MSNPGFWTYNLPLQVWPSDDAGNATILNYMPRKKSVIHLDLSEVLNGMDRAEFFEQAALRLDNLARLMREAGKDPALTVYYPDEGMPDVKAESV